MNRVVLRRAAAAAVIAAALAAGTPAHAASRPETPAAVNVLERAWQWIASFWGEEKTGGGVDPDGRLVPATPGTCGPACEIGGGIDPNG
jgi:hypothetical protein